MSEFEGRLSAALAGVDDKLAAMEQSLSSRAFVSSVESTERAVAAVGTSHPHTSICPVIAVRHTVSRPSRCVGAKQGDLQRQVDIALRFVEWFSRRGEAYEHNAVAIERHMKDLALTAHTRHAGVRKCAPVGCHCGCGGKGKCDGRGTQLPAATHSTRVPPPSFALGGGV